MPEKKETAAKSEKAPKIEQNGVTRPGAGTATGRIWEIADALSEAAGSAAKRGDVLKAAEAEGINVTTAATQFGRWCKFNGVKADADAKAAAKAAKDAAKAEAKAAKDAEKAAAKAAKDAEKAAKAEAKKAAAAAATTEAAAA